MLNTALGASCLSLLPAALAQKVAQPESLGVGGGVGSSQWQSVAWFNGHDRHIVSSHPNQPEHIVLHQYAGSLSASQIKLQLEPAVSLLLEGQCHSANPRLHQARQRYFLTFCSGSSLSSMQGYVAVSDHLNGPYRLQRTTPIAAATELSLFNDQQGETYALISDGEMIAVTPFEAKTQRTGKRTALWLTTANNSLRLTSPVLTLSRQGVVLAALDHTGQQLHQYDSENIYTQWQSRPPLAISQLNQYSPARLAFDSQGQLWSASNAFDASRSSSARVDLTPLTSVQRA